MLGQPYTVMVDYAHTPDSLAKVLDELRALTAGRLIAVFGAAGERDRLKRPVMGRLAAERCDVVVLTDEDPRLEDRRAIIEEIAAGARAAAHAMARAYGSCLTGAKPSIQPWAWRGPGDTVLLAGKGHESCIIMGTSVCHGTRRPRRAPLSRAVLRSRGITDDCPANPRCELPRRRGSANGQ